MVILQLILGLVIMIGILIVAVLAVTGYDWLVTIIRNKTRGTTIGKIINSIERGFWIAVVGLFIIVIAGMAINIGSMII